MERTVIIASRVGLHARPASIFAEAAQRAGTEVTIERPGGEPVLASSILAVMALGVGHGEEVTLRAQGPGAEEALDTLSSILVTDLDAEEGSSA